MSSMSGSDCGRWKGRSAVNGPVSTLADSRLKCGQLQELFQWTRSAMPKAELARSYGISRETAYQYLRRAAPERLRRWPAHQSVWDLPN